MRMQHVCAASLVVLLLSVAASTDDPAKPDPRRDALIGALNGPDESVRAAAALRLAAYATNDKLILHSLVKKLTDDYPCVRYSAAIALGRVGVAVEGKELDDLAGVITDKDPAVRYAVARALGLIGRDERTAVAALWSRLASDQDWRVRIACIEALRLIGPSTNVRISYVLPCLDSTDRIVRRYAAGVAPGGGSEESRIAEKLGDRLVKGEDLIVRQFAARSLGRMTKGGRSIAVAALATIARKGRETAPLVRTEAIRSLGHIAPPTDEVLSAVETGLRDSDLDVQAAAGYATRQLQLRKNPPQPAKEKSEKPITSPDK